MSSGARNREAPSGTSANKSKTVDMSYLGDKKLDKGKQKFMEDTQEWQKPDKSEREQSRAEKRQDDTQKKTKARTASKGGGGGGGDFTKKLGGCCALIFMMGLGAANFIMTIWGAINGNGVEYLDVQDTDKVKEVMFGGDPWLIYCISNATQFQKLPKVLDEESRSIKSYLGVNVGVLNCFEPTASGRSIADKYKWRSQPPVNFVVANGDKPRTFGLEGVNDYEALEKKVKPALTIPAPAKIDQLKKWPEQCTSRRTCVVLGHKSPGAKDAGLEILKPLQEKHRSLRIVTLDTSFWSLKLGDAVLASRPAKDKRDKTSPDILCLAKFEGSMDRGANDTHQGTFLQSLDSADAFMAQCVKQTDLIPFGVKPSIEAKTAKKKKPTVIKAPGLNEKPEPPKEKKAPTRKVDSVGSRSALDQDEQLFEAAGDGENEEEEEEEEEDDDDGEEVEL